MLYIIIILVFVVCLFGMILAENGFINREMRIYDQIVKHPWLERIVLKSLDPNLFYWKNSRTVYNRAMDNLIGVYDDKEVVDSPDSTDNLRDTIFKNIIRTHFGVNGLTFIINLSAVFAMLFVFILTVLIYMSVVLYEKIECFEKNKLNYPIIVNVQPN